MYETNANGVKSLMSDKAAALEQQVIEKLRTVFDPEIPVNVYELGLIYDIQFTPAMEERFDVKILMTLTTPNCPVAEQMPAKVASVVQELPALHQVDVELVWTPPWDKSRMSDEARLQLNMI